MELSYEMQLALASGVVVPRWLVWMAGKNTATGQTEAAGFWTGEDVCSFDVDGMVREYTGAGALVKLGDMKYEAGMNVQTQRLDFSMVSQEVEDAVSLYDLRLAPAEIHLALFDPDTGAVIGLARAFKGWVEDAQIRETGGMEASSKTLELSLVSSVRAGTKALAAKKSPESQKMRMSTDRGRDYADLAGEVDVEWKP